MHDIHAPYRYITQTKVQLLPHFGTYQRLEAKKALIGITHVAYLPHEETISYTKLDSHSNIQTQIKPKSLTFRMSFWQELQPAKLKKE